MISSFLRNFITGEVKKLAAILYPNACIKRMVNDYVKYNRRCVTAMTSA